MLYLIAAVVAACALYQLVSADNQEDPNSPTRSKSRPRHDLAIEDPASIRARASQEGKSMAQRFEESKMAYERRDRALAKSLSEQGKRHELKMEQLNAKASAIIFKGKPVSKTLLTARLKALAENNQDRPPSEVDLHGLYVKEAINYAEKVLANARQRGDPEVRLIVGQGNHSDGGISKLKPAIQKAMQIRGLVVEVDPRNPGVLVVSFKG